MLNLLSVRTPGVYIDEVPKFPPSIAAVETAIPAFIGYTQFDSYNGVDLICKPFLIESLVDFELVFGGSPPLVIENVDLDASNNVKTFKMTSPYYLYDSMRMYFKNGGGKCFVLTLGKYPTSFSNSDFIGDSSKGVTKALGELEKQDEPTLILFPDGVNLSSLELGSLYATALIQCEKYKDRFLIADVKINKPEEDKFDRTNDIVPFKTGIGNLNLNFGAAYYPYIKVNLPRQIRYRHLRKLSGGTVTGIVTTANKTTTVDWTANTFTGGDIKTKEFIDKLNITVEKALKVEENLKTYLSVNASIENIYIQRKTAFLAVSSYADVVSEFRKLFEFIFDLAYQFLDQYAKSTTPPAQDPVLANLQTNIIAPLLTSTFLELNIIDRIAHETKYVKTVADYGDMYKGNPVLRATWDYAPINAVLAVTGDPTPALTGLTLTNIAGADAAAVKETKTISNIQNIVSVKADLIYGEIIKAINSFLGDLAIQERGFEENVLLRVPVIKSTINYLRNQAYLLPPSGAVAGVYARVDNSRGVWKAPANESLVNVVAPSVLLTQDQHGELNVDPSTGKSINVIRSFVGKGNLIWGARTLAGNDNEWRYVNVRRLFNMIEESCKKATEQFVFESNDANTWVKVQAMIENFLTTVWRQGALFGATPDKAFYVLVGLNKTMTQLDILEGRMIVEIGIAANRPAEFIILRFSHKLPEA